MEKEKFSIWKEWLIAYALTITFVLQKLTDTIDWNWWWVLSPIWVLAGINVLLFLFVAIWFQISKLFKKNK